MLNLNNKFFYQNGSMIFPQPFEEKKSLMNNFLFKSDIAALQKVCDKLFNIPSNQGVYYQPILPAVMVTFAKNKQCGPTSLPYSEWGTVAYNEVIISFFVVRIKKMGAVWIAEKVSACVPYIFVDDPIAMVLGREIYGMPKIMSTVAVPVYPSSAPAPFTLETISTPKLQNGLPFKNMQIAAINQINSDNTKPAQEWTDVGLALDAMKNIVFGGGHIEIPGLSLVFEVVDLLLEKEMSFASLRQLRSIGNPDEAVHKAVIEFGTKMMKFNAGGILNGTFQLKLPQNGLFPIAEDLGISDGQLAESAFWIDWDFLFQTGTEIWSNREPEKTTFFQRLSKLF